MDGEAQAQAEFRYAGAFWFPPDAGGRQAELVLLFWGVGELVLFFEGLLWEAAAIPPACWPQGAEQLSPKEPQAGAAAQVRCSSGPEAKGRERETEARQAHSEGEERPAALWFCRSFRPAASA
jgi:hypothetical protein